MVEKIKVPLLPESVNDAVLSKWHKSVGDQVHEGDVIADLETDKIMLEVPSMTSGILVEIVKPTGSRVEYDEIICSINPEVCEDFTEDMTKNADVDNNKLLAVQTVSETAIEKMRSAKNKTKKGPSVRKKLYEQSASDTSDTSDPLIDARSDLQSDDFKVGIENTPKSFSSAADLTQGTRDDRVVPMTRLRQTIAKRLLESQRQSASLTTFNEVDLSKVMELRNKYKDDFKDKYGVKLGFMSFFTKACCSALQEFPEVNASVDGENIIYHDYCDIGIAVSTDKGLLVPIIRDAQQLDMAGVEENILDFSVRAKSNKISLDDLTGGTFSITNGGVFGSMLSTPILNPPQSAILGMHNIVKRPIVVDNEIKIRPMMYLALTYDHRIIDGSTAVRFLVMVKDLLEDPDRLLLQI